MLQTIFESLSGGFTYKLKHSVDSQSKLQSLQLKKSIKKTLKAHMQEKIKMRKNIDISFCLFFSFGETGSLRYIMEGKGSNLMGLSLLQ